MYTPFQFIVKQIGMSADELAYIFNVNKRTAQRWFSGKNEPPEDVYYHLRDLYQCMLNDAEEERKTK